MQSIFVFLVLAGIASAYPPYFSSYPLHDYPFKAYDGIRHLWDDLRNRDYIEKLHQSNKNHQNHVDTIKGHMEDFKSHVEKTHDLHRVSIDKLRVEINEHNEQIASLHAIVDNLNQEVISSHQQVLDQQKKNAELERVYERLFALYQELHDKLMALHVKLVEQHKTQVVEYQGVMEEIHDKIKGEAEKIEKSQKDTREDLARFDVAKILVEPVASITVAPNETDVQEAVQEEQKIVEPVANAEVSVIAEEKPETAVTQQ
ncbi:hypothetical protein L596_022105 [Steinernema carpocapsae]|uniref:SXP/RAL-2 family protein Ani s 5-like cation-binding domain-containing protein n=1 Tax=Steinernema carpocapsae TaxID=34508 RepID=A0A4U5MKU3_STECR|nr:hypothetical protein L596_022105 [Steinernema carpocapsae]